MPSEIHGIRASDVHDKVQRLIHALVNIRDESGQYTVTALDGTVIDTKGWFGWEWTHGIGLNGIWAYYSLTGKEEYLQLLEQWFAHHFADGVGTSKNINTMAPFLTLAHMYEKTGNHTYLPWLDSWGEWAYHDLERTKQGGMQHITYVGVNDQELWDDTLMMTVLPLAKIGQVLDRPHYIEEAKKQFLIHIQYLYDTSTGLFFHGWTFNGNHNFARALWARGNSWLTMAIPEFLDLVQLPAQDPICRHLTDTLEAQVQTLSKYQIPDSGLWPTLVDQPVSEGSYPEASATAGFAYGILRGMRGRYLPGGVKAGGEYSEVAVRAVKGILDNVSDDGELLQTSYGTPMGDTLQFYKDIPLTSMPYGQAMAVQALTEFLRWFI